MKCNTGVTDRTIRIIAGCIIMGWGMYVNNYWGLLGFIPFLTGIAGYCPLYLPFKINTNKKK